MISRRRARETPRIYSSCIRTHTRILRINRCIYDVARDTTTHRRRRVLQFRSSPFSSLLVLFLDPRAALIDESIVHHRSLNRRSSQFHPLLFFPFHASHSLSLSLFRFFPFGTRVSVRAFVGPFFLFPSFSPFRISIYAPFLSHRFSPFFFRPVTSSIVPAEDHRINEPLVASSSSSPETSRLGPDILSVNSIKVDTIA